MQKVSLLNQLLKTNYLAKFKRKKNAGYEISAKIRNSIGDKIVEPLTYLYNLSFSTGIIPNF